VADVSVRLVISQAGGGVLQDVSFQLSQIAHATQEASHAAHGMSEAFKEGIGIGAGIELAHEAMEKFKETLLEVPKLAVESVEHFAEMSDKLEILGTKIGTNTTMLQELAAAGRPTDTSLDSITGAIDKMKKKLGETPEAFRALGLETRALIAQNPADAFLKLGEKIASIENPTLRGIAAFKTLGKTGTEMLPLFSSNIAAVIARARELGIIIDEKAVAAGAKLNNEFKLLKDTGQGVWNNFAAGVASSGGLHAAIEILTNLMGQLSHWFIDNRAQIAAWTTQGIVLAVSGIQLLVSGVGAARDVLDFLRIGFDAAMAGVLLFAQAILTANLKLAELAASIPGGGLVSKLFGNDLSKTIASTKTGLDYVNSALVGMKASANDTIAANSKFHESLEKVNSTLQGAKEKIAGASLELEHVGEHAKGSAGDLSKWAQEVEELRRQLTGQDLEEKAAKLAAALGDEHTTAILRENPVLLEEANKKIEALVKGGLEKVPPKLQEIRALYQELNGTPLDDSADDFYQVILKAQEAQERMNTGVQMGNGLWASRRVAEEIARQEDERLLEQEKEHEEHLKRIAHAFKGISDLIGIASEVAAAFGVAADSSFAQALGDLQNMGKAASDVVEGLASHNPVQIIAGAVHGILAGISLIGHLFGGPSKAEQQAQAIGQQLGTTISESLQQAIQQTADHLHIDVKSASLLNLTQAITESGMGVEAFTSQIGDLMKGVASGSIPAAEGVAEIGKAFAQVQHQAESSTGAAAEAARRLGVQMIQEARAMGEHVPEIAAAVKAGLDKAVSGTAGAVKGIQIITPEDAQAQAQIFGATFWAKVKEDGLINAATAMKPAFDAIQDSLKKGGFDASAVMGPIEQIMGLIGNEATKNITEGIQGLQDALGGLADSGYMTQGAFQGFEEQAASAMKQLTDQGVDSQTALQAIAPLLAQAQQVAQQYGMQLDSNTQALIDQAKAAGVAFPTDPLQQVVSLLTSIATAMGAIPPAAQNAANGMNSSMSQAAQGAAAAGEAAAGAAAGAAQAAAQASANAAAQGTQAAATASQAAIQSLQSGSAAATGAAFAASSASSQAWQTFAGDVSASTGSAFQDIAVDGSNMAEALVSQGEYWTSEINAGIDEMSVFATKATSDTIDVYQGFSDLVTDPNGPLAGSLDVVADIASQWRSVTNATNAANQAAQGYNVPNNGPGGGPGGSNTPGGPGERNQQGAAFGGVATSVGNWVLHGSPSNPELVGPADALARSIGAGLGSALGAQLAAMMGASAPAGPGGDQDATITLDGEAVGRVLLKNTKNRKWRVHNNAVGDWGG